MIDVFSPTQLSITYLLHNITRPSRFTLPMIGYPCITRQENDRYRFRKIEFLFFVGFLFLILWMCDINMTSLFPVIYLLFSWCWPLLSLVLQYSYLDRSNIVVMKTFKDNRYAFSKFTSYLHIHVQNYIPHVARMILSVHYCYVYALYNF